MYIHTTHTYISANHREHVELKCNEAKKNSETKPTTKYLMIHLEA